MVKIPARMRTHCPKCNKHTEMTVKQERGGRRGSGLVKGSRSARRHNKGFGNKGKYSKKAITQSKMASKTSKKVDLRLTCTECKSTWVRSYPRTRRVEIVKKF
ncbi:MAG: 50S ribosomal protein L44e [Candidatus Heimdallarchaeota archaeon]|nr:50S ribosomal protein L44e [Candidatus Heimdallarchaeota archaeon]